MLTVIAVAGGAMLASIVGGIAALVRTPTSLAMSIVFGFASGGLISRVRAGSICAAEGEAAGFDEPSLSTPDAGVIRGSSFAPGATGESSNRDTPSSERSDGKSLAPANLPSELSTPARTGRPRGPHQCFAGDAEASA
jgi:hypothetical protein